LHTYFDCLGREKSAAVQSIFETNGKPSNSLQKTETKGGAAKMEAKKK